MDIVLNRELLEQQPNFYTTDYLNFGNQNISHIVLGTFDNLPNLQGLDLSDNNGVRTLRKIDLVEFI